MVCCVRLMDKHVTIKAGKVDESAHEVHESSQRKREKTLTMTRLGERGDCLNANETKFMAFGILRKHTETKA